MAAESLELIVGSRRALVTKNDSHPEQYLWIDVDGQRFFLGVLEKGMTRGDVKRMAQRWLDEHRQQIDARNKR